MNEQEKQELEALREFLMQHPELVKAVKKIVEQ